MATKLTLRMDERVIEAAKRHAAARGTSESRMVAAHVEAPKARSAGDPGNDDAPSPSPRVRALGGVLWKGHDPEATYREHPERRQA